MPAGDASAACDAMALCQWAKRKRWRTNIHGIVLALGTSGPESEKSLACNANWIQLIEEYYIMT
jgi:hypothetical protein